jgi:hypothetical protein
VIESLAEWISSISTVTIPGIVPSMILGIILGIDLTNKDKDK